MCDHISYMRMTEIASTLFSYLCDNDRIIDALEDRGLDMSDGELAYFLGISNDDIKGPVQERDKLVVQKVSEWKEEHEYDNYDYDFEADVESMDLEDAFDKLLDEPCHDMDDYLPFE